MGKVKRRRKTFHLSNDSQKPDRTGDKEKSVLPFNIPNLSKNIFDGVDINLDQLKKDLKFKNDDNDGKSVRSFKSLKSELGIDKQLAKKDKIQLRHQFFMKKLDFLSEAKKQEKLRKKREKTVITGDIQPLLDALPDLKDLTNETSKRKDRLIRTKKKAIDKDWKRKKVLVKNVKSMLEFYKTNDFRNNPLQTVFNILNPQ